MISFWGSRFARFDRKAETKNERRETLTARPQKKRRNERSETPKENTYADCAGDKLGGAGDPLVGRRSVDGHVWTSDWNMPELG